MSGPRKYPVFISYARDDSQPAAESLRLLLDQHVDVTAKLAPLHGDHGAVLRGEWRGCIKTKFSAADSIVFLLSPLSVSSKVCTTEIEAACRQGARLHPVLTEKDRRPARLPRWLKDQQLQRLQLSTPDVCETPEWQRFVADLCGPVIRDKDARLVQTRTGVDQGLQRKVADHGEADLLLIAPELAGSRQRASAVRKMVLNAAPSEAALLLRAARLLQGMLVAQPNHSRSDHSDESAGAYAQTLQAAAAVLAQVARTIGTLSPELQARVAAQPAYAHAMDLIGAATQELASTPATRCPAEADLQLTEKAWRNLTEREIEKVIARGQSRTWADHKQAYRGRVFDFVQETYGKWIPGLLQSHLRLADTTGLYAAFTKAVSRHGLPEWLDVPTEPAAALRGLSAEERAARRVIRSYEAERQRRQRQTSE